MNMVDNLSGPMASIASRVGADVSKMDALGATFGNVAKSGAVMQEMGSQITGAVLAPVEATFETRRAIGELASLGVKDLEAVENAARNFSDQWAGTTKADFISAAYDIKSGIASLSDEGVAQFTELSGLTAKATKSTIGEMTSLFATGYGIYKGYYDDLTDLEFGEMFSAGIARSVQQFKTDGSQMASAIQTLGASATTSNVPLEEQLSILGMLQATMSGSEAGTKYKAFLRSATKGGEALGLSFTDANNQLLSMPEILDLLRGKFGETMDAAEKMELQKAFGDTEAVALIDLLYNKTDDLQGNILDMYDALGSGTGVATEMANAINETEPERFERLTQRIQNVKESIGNSLLPTINDLMSAGETVLTKVGSWIEENQELVKVIMLVVLAIGGFLTIAGTVAAVVGGVGLVITKAVSAFKILKAGFGIARAALSPLIGSVWSFTAALLANPVTWVVIGIVALIAAIVLLYNKCEWFRNLVNNILNFFREKLGAAFETAKAIFSGIGNVIGSVMGAARDTVAEKLDNMRNAYESHGGGIRGAAAAAIEGVKGIYTAGFSFLDNLTGGRLTAIKDKFVSGVTNIASGVRERFEAVKTAFSNGITAVKNTVTGAVSWFFESGKKVISTFANGIKSAFSGAVDAVKGGLQRIRNMLPFSDAKEGPLSTLTLSGQRTMTTYAGGLEKASNAPAQAIEKGLGMANNVLEKTTLNAAVEPVSGNMAQAVETEKPKPSVDREPPKKVSLSDGGEGKDNKGGSSGDGNGAKQVVIQKLLIPVDLKKIKDLQQLLELLKEVEDFANANESEETANDPEAVTA
ncbi:phage tail tape measure protein [Alistipes sp.]|jgi:TP901 family phage tail tape measure protein|uniref:phage tail tape measure protein n=4 Tax=Bacteria TaxID=2 RepID=UPI0031FCC744